MTPPFRPLGIALTALAAWSLAACAPPPLNTDAGADVTMMTDTPVAQDVAREAGAPLFARCARDTDCATGSRCDLSYPGGLCTRACTRDSVCGDTGWCYRSNCIPRCTPGANECADYSGLCFFWDSNAMDKRGCFPGCAEMPAAGEPACVSPRRCNPYGGTCEASPTVMGALNGEPCAAATDCAGGRCRLPTSATPMPDTPTGYLNGYCYSVTRRPETFTRNMPLPRGGCPMGSVVIPFSGEMTGDPVSCWKECTMDNDCRAGYFCNRVVPTGMTMPVYATGGCMPVDCLRAGTTCPAGTRCITRMGTSSRFGVCAADGDAGVTDGGTDASAAEAGADVVPSPDASPDVSTDASTDGGLDLDAAG